MEIHGQEQISFSEKGFVVFRHIQGIADLLLQSFEPLEEIVHEWLVLRVGHSGRGTLSYFRTRDGMEIDYILEFDKRLTPIEVKWTENPNPKDVRHLRTFHKEHGDESSEGYLVCRCPRPAKLAENITAIPWWAI